MDITIEGLLLGLLAVAIGLAFCFYGFRLFLILLPIWGFFAGLPARRQRHHGALR